MADPIIRVKRSTVAGKTPTVDQLGLGELAINHYDGKLFIRQDTLGVGIGTTVIQVGLQGIQGTEGAQGTTGTQGFFGSQGTDGAQGVQGPQGTTGTQGTDGVQGSIGSIESYSVKTSNYTASSKEQLIADTSGGSFTITLPATPSTGDLVRIADGDDWSSNNLIIGRNGSTIEGSSEDLTVDIGSVTLDLVYDGTTWEVFTSSGVSIISPDDITTDSTYYPLFVDGAGGDRTPSVRTTSTAFSFNPSTCTLTAVDFNATSDINLKTNIREIKDPLEKIMMLKGVSFNWKKDNRASVGIIAQDVEKLFPELVGEVNGEKTVNYNGLIALLIESIKELNIKMEDNQ